MQLESFKLNPRPYPIAPVNITRVSPSALTCLTLGCRLPLPFNRTPTTFSLCLHFAAKTACTVPVQVANLLRIDIDSDWWRYEGTHTVSVCTITYPISCHNKFDYLDRPQACPPPSRLRMTISLTLCEYMRCRAAKNARDPTRIGMGKK
jgi:hypothetical protein